LVYRLSPGSSSWQQVNNTSGNTYISADVQGKYAIVVGNSGVIQRSDNFMTSATFAAITAPSGTTTTNFNNVVMYDRSRAYILGAAGVLIKTVDYANTWVQKNTGSGSSSVNLTTLALNKRDHLVFAGSSGYAKQVNDQADFASSLFWYDRLGRMVVSQNTKQFNKSTQAYSYTLYDPLGRITEVGEKATADRIETTLSGRQIDDALLSTWISNGGSTTRTEITQTFYDNQQGPSGVISQRNTKKRVTAVYYMDVHAALSAGATTGFGHATYYSYDVHGNVDHLVQDVPDLAAVNNQYKHLYYHYDLISGKVNQVDYSPGQRDEYHHRYSYDADNRIVQVETSKDAILWDKDANYEYYKHGPLSRTELGDLKVQGLDYAYTIQGWIKGVNSNTMSAVRDPGRDGDLSLGGNTHAKVATDAFGYTLGYFAGDYNPIGTVTTANKFEASTAGSDLLAAHSDLWNGNISHMVTCLPKASDYTANQTITPEAFGSAYQYDQLNRLSSSRVFTNINTTTNQWQSGTVTNPTAYATDYTYDAMGNILTQKRNGGGASPTALDELTYNYHTTTDGLVSNRLYQVNDVVSAGNYSDDIDDQGTFNNTHSTIETANNYGYDELGNLVRDVQEEIASIEWTVYGKMKKITRNSGSSKADLEFGYDASGNRLWKKVTPKGSGAVTSTYYYLRDAQGNEMCRYVKYTNTSSQLMYVAQEHSIYGSSRVGVDNRKDTLYMGAVYTPTWGGVGTSRRALGLKSFELANHLGNILVTISDKPIYNVSSGTIYFQPEITSISDYYPFGAPIQGRSYSSSEYRFGFNTQEKTDEISGTGNHFTAQFWEYDGRLGQRWNVDPLAHKMPFASPYNYCLNNPINMVDPDGRIPYPITIRGFAPFKEFGFGFHGDGRGYSTGNVSARVHQKINFDTDKTTMTTTAWSSPTWKTSDPSNKKTAIPSVNFTGDFTIKQNGDNKTFGFGSHVAAANPLTPPGTPNIDIFSNFSITENKKAGTLSISGSLRGDNFPSTEAFITDPAGKNLFIGIGQIAAGVDKDWGPLKELPFENTRPITSFNFTVTTDKNGNFTGVQQGKTTYTLDAWNKLFTSKPTQKTK
jgi:RHS repeat-associated protein